MRAGVSSEDMLASLGDWVGWGGGADVMSIITSKSIRLLVVSESATSLVTSLV